MFSSLKRRMEVHRGLQQGWNPAVVEEGSFSTATQEGALNRDEWQKTEAQEDACSLVGSTSICSNKHEREVRGACCPAGRPDVWDDNDILSCLDQLSRTFNPLGKSIDFVQSDLMSITKERASIIEEIRRYQIELQAEKKQRHQILQQETRRLEKAKIQLQQEKDEIAALEAQIFNTQARIQLIMRGATDSEEVKRFAAEQACTGAD